MKMISTTSLFTSAMLALWGAAHASVNAQVAVTPNTQGAGPFVYGYSVMNQGNESVLSFGMLVEGPVTEISSPPGWQAGSTFVSHVTWITWVSPSPGLDLGPGESLAGFGFRSAYPSGEVRYQSLSVLPASNWGLTIGPNLPPPLPPCQADVNGDGAVNTSDLLILLGFFGQPVPVGSFGDITQDGFINTLDLLALLHEFGRDECV